MSQNYILTWRFSGETLQWEGGGRKSICMFQSCFYQKAAYNCKSIILTLEGPLQRLCVHLFSDFHDNSDAYLRQALNSQNHLNSHCRIQILFIKLQSNFMNFNQYSSTCTQTFALKIPVLIFNFLKKTPKHKYLSIYSDEWHLKPTGLAVHYKHSSSSLVLTKKLLIDKLPGLSANWSQILILEHPNLQVKSTKQNQLGGISIFFRQYWKMFPNSLY